MKFGIVDKIYHDEYLSDHICPPCGKNFSTKLVIYCRAFATGFTWWAWKKQGYTECNSCGAIYPAAGGHMQGRSARLEYGQKGIPLKLYVPTVIAAFILLTSAIGKALPAIREATTSTQGRLTGMWYDRSNDYRLYIFPKGDYTLTLPDTIIFGHYSIDDNTDAVSIPVMHEHNTMGKVNPQEMLLSISRSRSGVFVKAVDYKRGANPYELQYNNWRVKATHQESPAEIKARVLSYLHYVQLRYQWAYKIHLNYLPPDVYSPIMQSSNGIGINEESCQRWASMFYSKDNLDLANRFMYRTFPADIEYDADEPNPYLRNLKAIDHYIQVAEATDIRNALRGADYPGS